MNRSLAYAVAGVMLAGLAVWMVRHRENPSYEGTPLDEVDRMMSQTRQKLGEIQDSFNEFRQVITQATVLDAPHPPAPAQG